MNVDRGSSSSCLTLGRVTGIRADNAHTLQWRPATDEIAYVAGTIVVFYSTRLNKQVRFISCRSPICCIAFDRLGHYAAIAEGSMVSIHPLDRPEPVRVCRASSVGSPLVAFLGDSSILLVCGQTINIWDWRSGQRLASADASDTIMAMDVGDSTFMTCSTDSVSLWELGEGSSLEEIPIKMSPIVHASLLDDGAFFLSVCFGHGTASSFLFALTSRGVLCRFNRRTLEKWVDLRLETGYSLVASHDLLAIGGAHGKTRLFTADTIAHVSTLSDDSSSDVRALAFSQDNKRIACLHSSGCLFVWDHQRTKVMRHLSFHGDAISDFVPIEDGMFTSSLDGTIRQWADDTDDCKVVYDFNDNEHATVLAVSAEFLVCGGSKGTLLQWSRDFTLFSSMVAAHPGPVLSLDIANNLLVSSSDTISVFQAQNLSPAGTFHDHQSPVDVVRFAVGADRLISSSSEGTFVRDMTLTTAEAPQLLADIGPILVAGPGKFVLSASLSDGAGVVWDATTGQIVRRFEHQMWFADIDRSGALLVGCCESRIIIVDWNSMDVLVSMPVHGPTKARFSVDGHRLYTFGGDDSGSVAVWKLGSKLTALIQEREGMQSSSYHQSESTEQVKTSCQYGSDDEFIEFSDEDDGEYSSNSTTYTSPGATPIVLQDNDVDLKMKSVDDPVAPMDRESNIEVRRIGWRGTSPSKDRQSPSPAKNINTIGDIQPPPMDPEQIAGDLRQRLETAIVAHQAQPSATFMALFSEVRARLDEAIGAPSINPMTLSMLDAESTKLALETYSGRLIDMIQSQVEKALSSSLSHPAREQQQ